MTNLQRRNSLNQALPEPMNASPHHSKVKVVTTLSDPVFVSGTAVTGKLEMECRADRGLGIGIMVVELFAIQELTSRDHSATSTFLHSRRLFQGPGLPPSNAVQVHPLPGDPPLPQHYHQARRGKSTFLFKIPLPASSPSSIVFGNGLAKVRYELRASVGVFWKNEKRLVVDKQKIDVVEAFPYDELYAYTGGVKIPEAIIVGEGGKIWMQGRLVGGVVVAGSSACLELQVKNHSNKKNSGLTLTLSRTLYLPVGATGSQQPAPIQISDTLTTVPFRGPEYVIPPGAEGVANLVFDVPKHARGVKGGTLDGEEASGEGSRLRHTESLFEIRCKIEVKLTLGMGSKDIVLDLPVEIIHPRAMPAPNEIPAPGPYAQPFPGTYDPAMINPAPYPAPAPVDYHAYLHGHGQIPPSHMPYVDPMQNQVWLPPPMPPHAAPYPTQGYSPVNVHPSDPLFHPPQPAFAGYHGHSHNGSNTPPSHPPSAFPLSPAATGMVPYVPTRPLSAGPVAASHYPQPMHPGLPTPPVVIAPQAMSALPLHDLQQFAAAQPPPVAPSTVQVLQNVPAQRSRPLPQAQPPQTQLAAIQAEEGKGERALRVSNHLKMSSRHRSVSPQSHRFPLPGQATIPEQEPLLQPQPPPSQPPPQPLLLPISTSPPNKTDKVVHSPRPQLTPKTSFTRDPVLGAMSKSERVEELEKMADAVGRKSQDLSGDLPRGILGVLEEDAKKETNSNAKEANVNKTLPGPPVPSGKNLLTPPSQSRARADVYFSKLETEATKEVAEAPPPPALLAALPTRPPAVRSDRESGLDALERRLLKEVGTRKVHDTRRPDARSVLAVGVDAEKTPRVGGLDSRDQSLSPANAGAGGSMPIRIPVKSPEPLNDSAISSLTLAGGLGGDDSDGDGDNKTHKAGSRDRSRDGSRGRGAGRSAGRSDGGLHRHMRERAEGRGRGTTPTKVSPSELERVGLEGEGLKVVEKDKKEGKSSGKKKDKSSAAKGRVAAWLGRIEPDIPPQEQDIPPSPSVVRIPDFMQDDDGDDGEEDDMSTLLAKLESRGRTPGGADEKGTDARPNDVSIPNPRSSGFVPIATLNRNTIQLKNVNAAAKPVLSKDATVMHEARKVQDIWSLYASPSTNSPPSQNDSSITVKPNTGASSPPAEAPRYPFAFSPNPALTARPQSIRTDRRVSPPSATAAKPPGLPGPSQPLSYSAAARNVWKLDHAKSKPLPTSPLSNAGTTPVNGAQTPSASSPPVPLPATKISFAAAGRLPNFPPGKPIDPEVKYDIRSARGGRGGKVTAVANLWASGAVTGQSSTSVSSGGVGDGKVKEDGVLRGSDVVAKAAEMVRARSKGVEDVRKGVHNGSHGEALNGKPPLPEKPQPLRSEKKLFSAAVMTPAAPPPAPKSAAAIAHRPVSVGIGAMGASKPTPSDAQKRPDSRNVFTPQPRSNVSPPPHPAPKRMSSSTALLSSTKPPLPASKPSFSRSTEALVKHKPDFSIPFSSPAKSVPLPPSTDPKLHQLAAKGVVKTKAAVNVIKAKSDIALSSSHAVPHLSSTASLARPHGGASSAGVLPIKTSGLGITSSTKPVLSSAALVSPTSPRPGKITSSLSATIPSVSSTLPPRSPSPTKPAELAFGQARLRDLIKKYQGQPQKS